MKKEEMMAALEVLNKGGIVVAGDFVMEKKVDYEIANVEAGGIGIQIKSGVDNPMTVSDKDIKAAIVELQEAKDEDGEYLMHDYDQWYGVFRVLSHYCGYPTKPKDFEMTMKNIGADSFRLPCIYENFRKVKPNKLPQNIDLWKQYLTSADQYSLKQIKVVVKLMEILNVG